MGAEFGDRDEDLGVATDDDPQLAHAKALSLGLEGFAHGDDDDPATTIAADLRPGDYASDDEDSDASDDEGGPPAVWRKRTRARSLVPYTAEATGSVLRLFVESYWKYVEALNQADAPGLAELLGALGDILASGTSLVPRLALDAFEIKLRIITDGMWSGCVVCRAFQLVVRDVTPLHPFLQAVSATRCTENASRRLQLRR